jgi:hypothetical protein
MPSEEEEDPESSDPELGGGLHEEATPDERRVRTPAEQLTDRER